MKKKKPYKKCYCENCEVELLPICRAEESCARVAAIAVKQKIQCWRCGAWVRAPVAFREDYIERVILEVKET